MSDHPFEPPVGDDALAEELASALGYDPDRTPPPDRVAAIRAEAERLRAAARRTPSRDSSRRHRRRAAVAGGLAAGVGGVVGFLAPEMDPDRGAGPAPSARAFPAEATGPDGDEPSDPA